MQGAIGFSILNPVVNISVDEIYPGVDKFKPSVVRASGCQCLSRNRPIAKVLVPDWGI